MLQEIVEMIATDMKYRSLVGKILTVVTLPVTLPLFFLWMLGYYILRLRVV